MPLLARLFFPATMSAKRPQRREGGNTQAAVDAAPRNDDSPEREEKGHASPAKAKSDGSDNSIDSVPRREAVSSSNAAQQRPCVTVRNKAAPRGLEPRQTVQADERSSAAIFIQAHVRARLALSRAQSGSRTVHPRLARVARALASALAAVQQRSGQSGPSLRSWKSLRRLKSVLQKEQSMSEADQRQAAALVIQAHARAYLALSRARKGSRTVHPRIARVARALASALADVQKRAGKPSSRSSQHEGLRNDSLRGTSSRKGPVGSLKRCMTPRRLRKAKKRSMSEADQRQAAALVIQAHARAYLALSRARKGSRTVHPRIARVARALASALADVQKRAGEPSSRSDDSLHFSSRKGTLGSLSSSKRFESERRGAFWNRSLKSSKASNDRARVRAAQDPDGHKKDWRNGHTPRSSTFDASRITEARFLSAAEKSVKDAAGNSIYSPTRDNHIVNVTIEESITACL